MVIQKLSPRDKIETVAREKSARWDIVEKDYALSYVLFGIAKHTKLSKTFVFKGGTALKKCYFGNYRFSEDLDFSSVGAPTGQLLEKDLTDAMLIAKGYLVDNHGNFDIKIERKLERNPHPHGQESFNVQVKFPHHRANLALGIKTNLSCSIKIEITHDEPVVLMPVFKPIIHDYDEPFDAAVACYHIEEIIAEKLRALLQTHEKLMGGKMRPRPRDYYDLYHLLKNYREFIDVNRLNDVLQKKCHHRSVSYDTVDDFFTPLLLEQTHKSWQSSLHLQMADLPKCQDVLDETKVLLSNILILTNGC